MSVKKVLRNLMLLLTVLALIIQITPLTTVVAMGTTDGAGEQLEEPVRTVHTGDDEPKPDEPELPLSTAETEGFFYFMAVDGDELVAKPIKVDYGPGDTIASALVETGYTFEGLDEGIVTSVNDVEGVYGCASSNADADLERMDVTPEPLAYNLLVFQTDSESFTVSGKLLQLATELLRYEESEKAQRYIVAKNLYQGILRDLPGLSTDDARAEELYRDLQRAINDAENQDEGTKFSVKVELTHGGEELTAAEGDVVFTNRFGATYTAVDGDRLELSPGDYNFTLSIHDLNKKAKGKFTVEEFGDPAEEQTFALDVPGNDYWLQGVCFGLSSSTPTVQYDPVDSLSFDFSVIDNSTSTTAYAGQTWSAEALKFNASYRKAAISYLPTNSTDLKETQISNSSTSSRPSTSMTYFIPAEGGSRTVPYVVTLNDVDQDILFTQEYTLNLVRPRTLAGLEVLDEEGPVHLSPEFSGTTYAYTAKVLETTSVNVRPTAFAGYDLGYRVYVNDELAPEGDSVSVVLKPAGETQDPIKVQVRHTDGTLSAEYSITPELLPAVSVNISIPKTASLEVLNSVGTAADFSNLSKDGDIHTYTFNLPEGLSYKYVVTQNTYYTTSGSFVAADDVNISTTVDTTDYVDSIKIRQNTSYDYYLDVSGEEVAHELFATLPDYYSASRMTVKLKEEYKTGRTISASYLQQTLAASSNNVSRTINLNNGKETTLTSFITAGGRSQHIDLVVQQIDGQFTRQQIYHIKLDRELHLRNSPAPSFAYDGQQALYSPTFNRDQFNAYEVIVPDTATELLVQAGQNGTVRSEDIEDPYVLTINGIVAEPTVNYATNSPMLEAVIPLNGTNTEEEITIDISNSYGGVGQYKFTVKKVATMAMTFGVEPVDALFTLYDGSEARIWPDESGQFNLLVGMTYKYVLSKYEYVSLANTFVADQAVPHIDLALELAAANENIDPTIDVEWNKFRGEDNTGVTTRETPASAEEAQLYWAYMSSSMSHTGQPIVLDDYVAVFTGNKLQYLDPISGELVAEGIMFSGGGIIPVYSDGMIFAPVTSGLQAFNATPRPQTAEDVGYTNSEVMVLDSLWTYKDPIGGGGMAPFYVKDGYIYGGWQQLRNPGAFVCLSITDEDPSQTHEEKEPVWRWVRSTGFYWAGAHVSENFVVVGGEVAGDDDLTCLDARTGKVLDTIPNLFTIENRGSVSYDKDSDRYCLNTKDTFYSVRVDENGKFYDLKQGSIGGMSTSTPAIYNGRAYIGISGNGQFQSFTGSGIMVIDIETAQPVYAMATRGYPQASGLVSTAYLDVPHYNPQTGQEETGFVYVYFTENVNPGNISYIIDKPGITEPVISDNVGGIQTAPLLFAPKGHHSQYNLSSLQVDKYGTLYMKTDRGYIMAIGQKIEEIEVVTDPEHTVYYPGEVFDPTGIKVIAKYVNGFERDVTNYVKFSENLLTTEQTSVDVTLPYALYNNYTPNDYIDSIANSTFDKLPRPTTEVAIVVLDGEAIQSVEDIMSLIDEIGTVEYVSDSLAKIQRARSAYNLSKPIIRPAITNYQVLLDAEARYEVLDQAAKGKLPASEVVSDLSQLVVSKDGPIALNSSKEDLLEALTLNLEELKAVENGENIYITIEATVLNRVPTGEEFFAEAGLQENKLKSTGYVLDIRLSKEVETCSQVYVSNLFGSLEIELELPVPEEYRADGRSYYMLNVHGGGTYVFKDQGTAKDSVVIKTHRFSTYILAYSWLDTKPGEGDIGGEAGKPDDGRNPTEPDDGKKPLPVNPDGGGRLPVDPDDGGRAPLDPEDLATGDKEERSPVDVQDEDSDPNALEDGKIDNSDSSPDDNDAVGPDAADDVDIEGDDDTDLPDSGAQELIEKDDDDKPVVDKVLDKAGENLDLILLVSAIAAAIIVAGIILYKRRNKNDAADKDTGPDSEAR